MFQVPRRVLPPQKAYNLRGVVSEEANLEQNSATFSSRLKWLRVKSGHLDNMLVKDRGAACAEYLFKNIIVSGDLSVLCILQNKDPNHHNLCFLSGRWRKRGFSSFSLNQIHLKRDRILITLDRMVVTATTSNSQRQDLPWPQWTFKLPSQQQRFEGIHCDP